jgi:hypothetical protein
MPKGILFGCQPSRWPQSGPFDRQKDFMKKGFSTLVRVKVQ